MLYTVCIAMPPVGQLQYEPLNLWTFEPSLHTRGQGLTQAPEEGVGYKTGLESYVLWLFTSYQRSTVLATDRLYVVRQVDRVCIPPLCLLGPRRQPIPLCPKRAHCLSAVHAHTEADVHWQSCMRGHSIHCGFGRTFGSQRSDLTHLSAKCRLSACALYPRKLQN